MQTSMCGKKVINILAIYLCQNIKYYSNSFKSSWQVNSKLQHLLLVFGEGLPVVMILGVLSYDIVAGA